MGLDQGRKVMLTVSGILVAFVLLGGVLGRTLAVEGTYSFLKLFNEVLYLVRQNYVEAVKEETLMEGAYRGLLENLDPRSEYLTAEDFERAIRGERGGPADIGLILSKTRGHAVVIAAREGSTAKEAGLGAGDAVLTIGGLSTLNMGVWEATQALQGEPETEVEISVVRHGQPDRETLTLVRGIPPRARLTYEILEPGVAFLHFGDLQEGDTARLEEVLTTLLDQGIRKILLDLRANAGSELDEVVSLASLFTGGGLILTVEDRNAGNREVRVPLRDPLWQGDLAVLVDRGTANAAEVLAAALRDRTGAALVGERTWGLGSVQELIALPKGDGIRISVGKYLSPSGDTWNGTGLAPDVAQSPLEDPPASLAEDPQVRKALEVLREGRTLPEAA